MDDDDILYSRYQEINNNEEDMHTQTVCKVDQYHQPVLRKPITWGVFPLLGEVEMFYCSVPQFAINIRNKLYLLTRRPPLYANGGETRQTADQLENKGKVSRVTAPPNQNFIRQSLSAGSFNSLLVLLSLRNLLMIWQIHEDINNLDSSCVSSACLHFIILQRSESQMSAFCCNMDQIKPNSWCFRLISSVVNITALLLNQWKTSLFSSLHSFLHCKSSVTAQCPETQAGLIQCLSGNRISIQTRFIACWVIPWWATLAPVPCDMKRRSMKICSNRWQVWMVSWWFYTADRGCYDTKYTNNVVMFSIISVSKKKKTSADLSLN